MIFCQWEALLDTRNTFVEFNAFKMLFVTKPAKSAYFVNRGYANFQKKVWMRIICIPRLKIKEIISEDFW